MAKRIFIISDTFGSDPELGRTLMSNFLYSLARNAEKPSAVMLANAGVRLACEGSESLEDLQMLEAAGVMVRACTVCLTHYDLADKLRVGQPGSMNTAVAAFMSDGETLTIA